jgi:hypothetical protein
MIARQVPLGDSLGTDLLALPWKIGGNRPVLRLPPPRLGAHTEEFRARFSG